MRTRITLLAVSILVVAAASSLAGGGAFLTYQDAGDADTGYGAGLKYEFPLSSQLSADVRLSYNTGFTYEESYYGYRGRRYTYSEDISIIPLEANLNWRIPLYGYTPYFGAGLGYYYFDPDEIDAEVGFNIHGGINYDTGRGVSLFAELKYTKVEPENVDFSGIGLSVGASWGMW